jgi:hypothetical protein
MLTEEHQRVGDGAVLVVAKRLPIGESVERKVPFVKRSLVDPITECFDTGPTL